MDNKINQSQKTWVGERDGWNKNLLNGVWIFHKMDRNPKTHVSPTNHIDMVQLLSYYKLKRLIKNRIDRHAQNAFQQN